MEYETAFPPGFEESLDGLTKEQYWSAIDAYPSWYRFSLTRILVDESFHSLQPAGNDYFMNRLKYEIPTMDRANEFMHKHFNEPYRKGYYETRPVD